MLLPPKVKALAFATALLASGCVTLHRGTPADVLPAAEVAGIATGGEDSVQTGPPRLEVNAAAVSPEGELAPLTGHCDLATVSEAKGSTALAGSACEVDRDLEAELAGRMTMSTAVSIHAQARDDHLAGRIEAAAAGYARAIELDAQSVVEGPVSMLSHANRGMLRLEVGDDAGAMEDFQWVLQHDPAASMRATVLHNVALVQLERGELDAALASARASKAVLAAEHGKGHAGVAHALHTIGVIQAERGELDDAVDQLQQAVKIRRATLGKAHPHTALSFTSLGVALGRRGDWKEALAAHESALAIDERVLGPEHATTATDLAHIGSCLDALDRPAEARARFEAALEILAAQRPDDDPEVQRLRAWLDLTDP